MTESRVLGRYVLKHEIHKSATSTVWRAKDSQTDATVAVKIVPNTIETCEPEILQKLNHPNIVQLVETWSDDTNTYIVLKYVHGVPLTEHQRPKSDKGLFALVKQIISALVHLEENGVVHLRFEPNHILVDGLKHVTVIGFGSAVEAENAKKCDMCGGAAFLAPEFIKGEAPSCASDVWSCGVALYQLIVGQLPFEEAHIPDLLSAIMKMKAIIPDWVCPELQDLLRRMLEKNPKLRVRASALLAEEWLANSEKQPPIAQKPHSMHNLSHILFGFKKSEAMSPRDVPLRLSPAKVGSLYSWRDLKNLG